MTGSLLLCGTMWSYHVIGVWRLSFLHLGCCVNVVHVRKVGEGVGQGTREGRHPLWVQQ